MMLRVCVCVFIIPDGIMHDAHPKLQLGLCAGFYLDQQCASCGGGTGRRGKGKSRQTALENERRRQAEVEQSSVAATKTEPKAADKSWYEAAAFRDWSQASAANK